MTHKFRCEFGIADAIGYAILWFLLVIVTLGLAAFVLPYYLPKVVLNRTVVLDENGHEVGRLDCIYSLGEMIGNAILWLILSIVTLGLAYIVYIFRVQRVVLSRTRIVYNAAGPA
ncbi:DUF6693 family protein [Sulfitobacter sp. D35]|uniref:DUF6693 family protein n=1 Tax=Sulfitobacter sp. D35 TaxID=3083252 RepID=UPI00296EC5E6|nr:DUF6693 family protein [Sulfitobacter sp. D35]MDW4499453.1 DUF6693 family protein [Sulfitobacter sp. D35]